MGLVGWIPGLYSAVVRPMLGEEYLVVRPHMELLMIQIPLLMVPIILLQLPDVGLCCPSGSCGRHMCAV